jgi:hypothetical protein
MVLMLRKIVKYKNNNNKKFPAFARELITIIKYTNKKLKTFVRRTYPSKNAHGTGGIHPNV